MEVISSYFPELTAIQRNQFEQLDDLYKDWNSKINLISRKDIDNLYVHHVLHSLAIARVISFVKGTSILDVGTGGGFPGIPLAILFPDCQFTLVDSVGKKINVAADVAKTIGLKNVIAFKTRAEEMNGNFDFAISRAVAPLPTLLNWSKKSVRPGGFNNLPNGFICLKGGNIAEELKPFRKNLQKWNISEFFQEPYFEEKYVIFIPNYFK